MKLCLGTVQFGIQYGIQGNKQPDKTDCFGILDRAMENGIDTFDTAKAYGTSELILGEYFSGKKRSDFKIATKLETLVDVEKEVLSSLKNLKLDYVDFYLFHNGNMQYQKNAVEDIYKLKEKGLIANAGISVYTPQEAIDAVQNPLFDCIQIPYNVIDKRLDRAGFFETAIKNGKKVFTRSIFLQGLLLMDKNLAERKLKGSYSVVERYEKLCSKYNLSRLEFACGYIRQKKGIDYCLFGVDNIVQLNEQISLQKVDFPKEAEVDADIIFSDVEERILDPRQWNK